MKPSAYATKNTSAMLEINERDEKIAASTVYFDAAWVHEVLGCRDISVVGTKILSRTLGVKTYLMKASRAGGLTRAISKAVLKNFRLSSRRRIETTFIGAYSHNDVRVAAQLSKRNAVHKVIPQHTRAFFVNSKKVYFAYPMALYRTKGAMVAKRQIKEKAPDWFILDPERLIKTSGEEAMKESLSLVERSDAVVFIPLGKYLPRGVFEEVSFALEKEIPVFFLFIGDDGTFKRIEDRRYFSQPNRDDWTHYVKFDI